jgi:integrase/recombinase XerD
LARAIRATGVNIQTSRFHALRHAFALRLLLEGTPLKHISEVLGHRSFHSTSAYLRLDVEDLRQVALPVPKTLDAAECRKFRRCRQLNESHPERKNRWPGSVTVPATLGFRSFLARPMRDFLRLRRALGRSSYSDGWLLRSLDFFLTKHHVKGRVFTGAMFDQWAAEQLHLSPTTRCRWMHFIRSFCQYLLRTAPTTFVPDPRKFPKKRPPFAPCLLSPKDVARLLAATRRPKALFSPEHPLRPKTMHLAVLLLYCCGLRRSEAIHLTLGDIDTREQVLQIRHSKFHKSRLVPVSPSVNDELRKYLQQRHNHKTPTEPSSPLLWSGQAGGRADGGFSGGGLHWNWQQICRYAGVFNQRGVPPRLHDLRHSFAVTALQRAYHAGRDPQVTLPRLARYMGHVDFQFTHHYLKFTEPLRRAANERFRRLLADILVSSSSPKSTKGFTNE